MSFGRTLKLFLVDGSPGGLLTAEIMNWTGSIVAAPRSDLAALVARDEVKRTGIYILLGDDPESLGSQMAYIGESDDVATRLRQHARPESQNGKDFWDRAVVLTSKDSNLTKAHARYLEWAFIKLCQTAKRAKLINATSASSIQLPEADRSDMKYFVEQVQIVLPVLGVNIFRSVSPSTHNIPGAKSPSELSPVFELRFDKEAIAARAQEIDGEFTVLAGSTARREWVGAEHHYSNLREKLEQDGALKPSADGRHATFAYNYPFSSPSAAAAVVLGRNANGRTSWLNPDDGTTYGEWETRGIDEMSDSEAFLDIGAEQPLTAGRESFKASDQHVA